MGVGGHWLHVAIEDSVGVERPRSWELVGWRGTCGIGSRVASGQVARGRCWRVAVYGLCIVFVTLFLLLAVYVENCLMPALISVSCWIS